jgi:DNA uptake protein ComE-like DNA-binding protein
MIERAAIRQTFLGILAFVCTITPAMADGILDANTATRDEFAALAELDQALVETILANRPYETIGELNELLGQSLDAGTLEALYGRLFVPLKLNSASNSDIQLIPGVGGKMAHEFEEYRPYTSIEQFRREIGKYVDEQEVARLEQYITLQ